MYDPIESFEMPNGKTLEIYQDCDAESPREWDNIGTMLCWHSRYNLGDRQGHVSDMLYDMLCKYGFNTGTDQWEDFCEALQGNWCVSDTDQETAINTAFKKLQGKVFCLPLFLYDHGGITMSTSGFACPWDSGQVGIIYVDRETICKEFGWEVITKKREQRIYDILRGEVEVYDMFLTGAVYGFVVKGDSCPNCGGDTEPEDSCWGFYGYDHKESGLFDHAGYTETV